MKFVMKEYDYLESFKDKDIYTFEEIMDVIERLEEENTSLKLEIEEMQQEKDRETWEYDRGE